MRQKYKEMDRSLKTRPLFHSAIFILWRFLKIELPLKILMVTQFCSIFGRAVQASYEREQTL